MIWRFIGNTSVSGWSWRIFENSTDTGSVRVSSYSDVTIFSPGSSPWVSHDEVVLSVLTSVTNSGDRVVQWEAWTEFSIEDSTAVLLESSSDVDWNAGWLDGNGSLELSNTLWCNSIIRRHCDHFLGSDSWALSILTCVWVVTLKLLCIFF